MIEFLSTAQAAEMFKVDIRTIQQWIKNGRFPNAQRINPKAKRSPHIIPMNDIEAEQERQKNKKQAKRKVEVG